MQPNPAARGVMLPHLRAWRLARGLRTGELAKRAYCTRAWIWMLESGQDGASRRFLPLLALALDIDPWTLQHRAPAAARRAERNAAASLPMPKTPHAHPAPTAAPEGPAMAAPMT